MEEKRSPDSTQTSERRRNFAQRATQERATRREQNKARNTFLEGLLDIKEEDKQLFAEINRNTTPSKNGKNVSFAQRVEIINFESNAEARER